jgi:hypothetical protein
MASEWRYVDSSSIQTLLSVPELNRFSLTAKIAVRVADYTAGREFRPALKNFIKLQNYLIIRFVSYYLLRKTLNYERALFLFNYSEFK